MTLTHARRERSTVAARPTVAYAFALLACGTAVFSRLLVWLGLPAAINFLHLPLAVVAFLISAHPNTIAHRRARASIIAFAAFALFSGVLNVIDPLRTLAATILWLEPLFVAYVIWASIEVEQPPPRFVRIGSMLLVGIIAAQYVMMTMQLPLQLTLPGGDQMQGTFLRSGTGAHVAPAVVYVGVVMLLVSAFQERRARLWKLVAAAYGIALTQLALARAVTVAFVVAIVAGLLFVRSSFGSLWARVFALAVLLVGVWLSLPLLANVPTIEQQLPGWQIKAVGVDRIFESISRDPAHGVAGQGPGMTLSRVAMQTPDANLSSSSPIALLGFPTSEFTQEIVRARSTVAIAQSSLFSPATTFAGVLGDLGVVGLALYFTMWLSVLRVSLRGTDGRVALDVRILALAAFLLGGLQIWLEEPGFVLTLALFLGLSAGRASNAEVRLESPTR